MPLNQPQKIKVNVIKQAIEVINIPQGLNVVADKRTGAKSIYFPFQFPNGETGALIVTKLVKMGWQPADDIANITITFK